MAAVDAKDPRWIVAERADGTNVNQWHWTSKDITLVTQAAIAKALETKPSILASASPLLQHCELSTVKAGGECSVTSRKGRQFLIYELRLSMKWAGELRGEDGTVESASGELMLPDVSAEALEDLDVEFSTSARGSALSEAMRKDGVATVKRAVQRCISILQLHVAEPGTGHKLAEAAALAEARRPAEGAGVGASAAPAAKSANSECSQSLSSSQSGSGGGGGGSQSLASAEAQLPLVMRAMLGKVKGTSKGHVTRVTLSGCALNDSHLPPLLGLLHSSAVALEALDLSFNELSSDGLGRVLDVLGSGAQDELSRLHLGGNPATASANALDTALAERLAAVRSKRPDVAVDFDPTLRDAQPCCTVGIVYKNSPACRAGLQKGDVVLQFGMLRKGRTLLQRFGFQPDFEGIGMPAGVGDAFLGGCKFESVKDSVAPMVRALVGMPIDVIVRRESDAEAGGEGPTCHRLRLVPERWSGQGLLGTILK